jgi:hypothetical protein
MPLPSCPVIKSAFAPLLLLAFSFLSDSAHADPLAIYFKTSPRFELLRPFADPANLSVLVTQSDGRPLAGAAVRIRLEAPPPGRIFSTDFPIVEGTRLFDLRLPLVRGRAEWKYLFPIRGNYRLSVDVLRNQVTLDSQTFTFEVRENETKWFVLSMFLLALFVLGVIAGRVFTGANMGLAVLVAIAIAVGTPARALAPPNQNTVEPEALEVSPPSVGKLSHLSWHWNQQVSFALVSLAIVHLEKEKTVFAVERVPADNEFSMDFQFPDGAEYRVDALSEAVGRPLLRGQRLVNVTAVEPPVSASIPALLLFLAAIALGLGVGRWTKIKSN